MKKKVFCILGLVAMSAVLSAGCGNADISGQQKGVSESIVKTGEDVLRNVTETGADPAESGHTGRDLADHPVTAGKDSEDSPGKDDKFYIYSWNMELGGRLEYVYEVWPEMRERIQYVCIGTPETFQEEINRLLQIPGAEAYPDMITLDADWMMEYTNSDILLPVTDCGITEEDLREMNPYTITIAMDKEDYTLKGVAWQSSPGAFFYRADLAESLLGVRNPEEMQDRVGSWEGFLETAREVTKESGGMTQMLASDDGIMEIAMFDKAQPWIASDGVFHMDDAAFTYMDVIYALEREELTQKAGQGTEEWKEGFFNDSVLGYFGGVGLYDSCIQPDRDGRTTGQGTYGAWNVCQGPVPYSLGGTWLGVTAGCTDTALAGRIMKALCCDRDIMERIAEGTQDYVNNKSVMRSLYDGVKGSGCLSGGQNPVDVFASVADGVEVFWMGVYDKEIEEWLCSQTAAYAAGEKGRDEAVEDFKKKVAEALPAVTVE